MRVLDLGTGIGHVAMLVADLVGPQGSVVAIDSNARLLEVAAARASTRAQLRFVEGDVRSWRDTEPFDAIVGRLILFHLADPVSVLRHHAASLRPAGLLLALDFDLGSCRTEPALPLAGRGAWLGPGRISQRRGQPGDRREAGACCWRGGRRERSGLRNPGLHRTGRSRRAGPAQRRRAHTGAADRRDRACHPEQIGIDTLEARLADALRASGSVLLPPTLAAAWGRRG
jgi:SAM-dependent methyltransferase